MYYGIKRILERIQSESPHTMIYLQSILPVSDVKGMFGGHAAKWAEIKPLNSRLVLLAKEKGVTYIEIYQHFVLPDEEKLNTAYSMMGFILWVMGM